MLSFPFSDFLPLLGPQIFINSNLVFEALHGANAKSHPLTLKRIMGFGACSFQNIEKCLWHGSRVQH